MKAKCRKSGLTLSVCDDGLPQVVCDIHPIFRLDKEQLYKVMQRSPAIQPVQRRLYFLALLSLTDLVEGWDTPYIPNDETIELAFSPLVELHSVLGRRNCDLPTVRLAPDCDILEVIKVWRRHVYGFGTVSTATDADKMLAITETWHRTAQGKLQPKHVSLAIDCLYKLGYSDAACAAAASCLGMQVTAISLQRHRYLLELFEALQDCLPCNDQHRNISFYILRHVQDMIDHCVKVKADILGGKIRKEEQIIAGITSFQLVEVSEDEADKIQEQKRMAAIPEPKQADFPGYNEFIKARAAWRAARYANMSRIVAD